MKRFARRLSQIAHLNGPNKDVPSVVITPPSSDSIFQFEEAYSKNLGLRTFTPPPPVNGKGALLSVPSQIAKRNNKTNRSNNGSINDLSDISSISSFPTLEISSMAGTSYNLNDEAAMKEHHKKQNSEMLSRTSRFMSIMYAFLLIIIGAMCSLGNINSHFNHAKEIFFIVISLLSLAWLGFLHFDILKYKRWALKIVKPYVNGDIEIKIEDCDDDDDDFKGCNEGDDEEGGGNNNKGQISTLSKSNQDAYDSVSLNTAMIFDYVQRQPKPRKRKTNFDSISMASFGGTGGGGSKNAIETGYRYFQGKHSNDFYLKTGMIIFSFGSIMHLGVAIVRETYFFLHKDKTCQDPLKLTTNCIRAVFSFYQLFIAFKYSNIIINRYQNLARFALMHLLATSISIWLDTITDEVIEDYVSAKLGENMTEPDAFEEMLESNDQPFREHLIHTQNCSRLAIVSNQSMSALPYLYPFTIEFNIAIASVWYMIWTNIGKVNDKSLFHSVKEEIVEDENGNEEVQLRSTGLSMQVDCHSSNRGLFTGLAFLLAIIITIVIFFSTIKTDVYAHFSVATYSLQAAVLTICSFIVIPLAYFKIQRLDLVNAHHRDNAFTIMDDILVLVPIPFYFVHYSLSIIANILDTHEPQFERANNLLLSVIELLTIAQVMTQSVFIVDGLRRCSNNPKVRRTKPGRELIIFALILNVTLWILNTFELKSAEVHLAPHHYYGEFTSMILSHSTVPIMLFYRFHSSVCLSNIWKYAYEKDE